MGFFWEEYWRGLPVPSSGNLPDPRIKPTSPTSLLPEPPGKPHSCSAAKSLWSCPTLCDPLDHSLPGFSAHGILQARILEWLSCPTPGDFPGPGIEPVFLMSPALAGGLLTTNTTWEAHLLNRLVQLQGHLRKKNRLDDANMSLYPRKEFQWYLFWKQVDQNFTDFTNGHRCCSEVNNISLFLE